jgi:hypothetical protein
VCELCLWQFARADLALTFAGAFPLKIWPV